jgi:anti-anti-sigma factor
MASATIEHEDVTDRLRIIRLGGRLDMQGVNEIDLKFTSLSAARPLRVVVDLRPVSFLASIGIRSLISSARALDSKGGRMVVLLGGNELVRTTLEATGIGEVIPLVEDETEARRQALA